ncbi:MAG: hypothetical protein WAU72_03095 [Acidimicrobiia bacterium]
MSNDKKILYASIGSNMRTARFMAYISGGPVKGTHRIYKGCRDNTPPTNKVVLASHIHHVYFARSNDVWGETPYSGIGNNHFGGLGTVGFKHLEEGFEFDGLRNVNVKTELLSDIIQRKEMLSAGYPITIEQFCDVMSQENDLGIGQIELAEELIYSLTLENPLIDLRNRTGNNAIILPNGEKYEINIEGHYSGLLYLGDVDVDGETLRAICFTSPFSYEMALVQSYLGQPIFDIEDKETIKNNLAVLKVSLPEDLIEQHADSDHFLNPATTAYLTMIASGVEELGQGNSDWTRENSFEYLLSLAPFNLEQFSKQTKLVRKTLGLKPKYKNN